VIFYQLGLRIDVLRPMLGGTRTLALAAIVLAASAGAVYWLAAVHPAS